MSELEKTIERYLVKQVEDRNGMCLKFNSDSMRGVPDRIVVMNPMTVFVELKAPGEQPRPEQERCFDKIVDAGGDVFVIDNKDDVDDFVHLMTSIGEAAEKSLAMVVKEEVGLQS
mgnify:CR=1 FL=1